VQLEYLVHVLLTVEATAVSGQDSVDRRSEYPDLDICDRFWVLGHYSTVTILCSASVELELFHYVE
jgi:hypothetical protein